MDGGNYVDYFLKPQQSSQRRYEALRAVFVEELSLKDVSQQFGISYGTIRNWVSDFCCSQDTGDAPLFLYNPPWTSVVRFCFWRRIARDTSCGRSSVVTGRRSSHYHATRRHLRWLRFSGRAQGLE